MSGAIMVAYFAVCGAIGVWAARRTRSAADFFVAGKRLGLWTLALASMASTLSGFVFIGGPGLVTQLGMGAAYIVLPSAVTGAVGAWVLGKRLRLLGEVRGAMTVPDAIGARYRSRAAQGLAAVAILVATVGYAATNVLALGVVVQALTGWPLGWSLWLGTAVVFAYSVSGGILAGIYTDLFQGALMAGASTLVFAAALASGGGLSGLSATILAQDPGFLSPWGAGTLTGALSFYWVFSVGTLAQPHVVHKYYMLRDARHLRWYPLVMGAAMLLTVLLYLGVGVAMKAALLRGDVPALATPDAATPTFLRTYAGPALGGLVFAGVLAAIMSTVNAFLNVGAAALVHDLPRALGQRAGDALRRGRWATVLIAVLATLVAQGSGQLVAFLGIFGFGLFSSTLVPALAIGLNWPGGTRAGALASIGTGLVVTLVAESAAFFKLLTIPRGVSVAGASLAASTLVYVVVSWWTRRTADDVDPDIRALLEC
jgi:Na+/proline symporter